MERRLAAIFTADVAGYSRLVGAHGTPVIEDSRKRRLASRGIGPSGVESRRIGAYFRVFF
jgi:hypothetical protein